VDIAMQRESVGGRRGGGELLAERIDALRQCGDE